MDTEVQNSLRLNDLLTVPKSENPVGKESISSETVHMAEQSEPGSGSPVRPNLSMRSATFGGIGSDPAVATARAAATTAKGQTPLVLIEHVRENHGIMAFVLHCRLDSAFDVPSVSGGGKQRFFTLSAAIAGTKVRSQHLPDPEVGTEGILDLGGEVLSIPFATAQGGRIPTAELRLSFARESGLGMIKQEVGRTKIPVQNAPVFDSPRYSWAAVPPTDLYIQKPTLKMLPPHLKLRKGIKGFICVLKVRIWITALAEESLSEVGADLRLQRVNHGVVLSMNKAVSRSQEVDGVSEAETESDDDQITSVSVPPALEWPLVDMVVPWKLSRANKLLFISEEFYVLKFFNACKYTESSVGAWSNDNRRTVQYRVAGSRLLKSYRAREEQEYLIKCKSAVVVLAKSHTPEVPFGSSFQCHVQYKLLAETLQTTRIIITATTVFTSSCWMKGPVSNGAKNGMIEIFKKFAIALRTYTTEIDAATPSDPKPTRTMYPESPCDKNTPIKCDTNRNNQERMDTGSVFSDGRSTFSIGGGLLSLSAIGDASIGLSTGAAIGLLLFFSTICLFCIYSCLESIALLTSRVAALENGVTEALELGRKTKEATCGVLT